MTRPNARRRQYAAEWLNRRLDESAFVVELLVGDEGFRRTRISLEKQ
ncbi:hypothetical protein [Streptomyces sp. NPDC021212]